MNGLRFVLCGTLAVFLAPVRATAAPYYAAGSVTFDLCDDWTGAEHFSDAVGPAAAERQMHLSGSYEFPCGNRAAVSAEADLITGVLKTYAYTGYGDPNPFWTSTATAQASLYETLRFTVPPGYYEDGARVRVRGGLSGRVFDTSPGSMNAAVRFDANFKGDEFHFEADSNSSSLVDEAFEVSNYLVTPGSTLEEPVVVGNVVVFTRLVTLANVSPETTGYSEGDFWGTARLLAIETPEGVTWESASGEFLAAIPEPNSALLALGGLLGTAALVAARRRKMRGAG